jgi:Ca2+-transporting ATPase
MINNPHNIEIKELLGELRADALLGLAESEYKKRLKHYGSNVIPEQANFRTLKILWSQIMNPLAIILIVAGSISYALHDLPDTIIIFIAVIINTGIGAYQEGRADKALQKLRSSVKQQAIVIRDGHEAQVDAETLVPGDIIIVRAGDSIGADARLIEARSLSLNESVITGEWLPNEKDPGSLPKDTHFTERKNMLWMGTSVTEGWGRAVIVATAAHTEFNKIAGTLKENIGMTPFQKGIHQLARSIGIYVTLATVIIFILGLLRGEEIMHMFLTSVAIAVAAVPEGLPIATTVILAVGMGRILTRGGLAKNLVAAETLGSTSIILTDKTGTLTKAEMQVADIIVPNEIFGHKISDEETAAAKTATLETAILSSDAFIENTDADLKDWIVRGKPTEKAIFAAGIAAGLHPHRIQENNKRIDFFPFDAERRIAASLNMVDNHSQISITGAPEKVLSFSTFVRVKDKNVKLTAKHLAELTATYEEAVSHGSRVLGVACRLNNWQSFPQNENIFAEFVFLGFIAFHDPLRSDVKNSLKEAREAGVRAIMLTGDHISTATTIAKEVGLITHAHELIIDGVTLEKMDDRTLEEKLPHISCYARVLPHQKLRIVEAWQRRGEVVAMTGDGVNDAPALKRADIGIALGSGTDVAKEAADLVLINNSFSVIIAAIEEGRTIMDNIRKALTFLLATGFTEIILIGGALIGGLPLPILPIHILWANLIEEGFMNFAFAFEPQEKDIMRRDPREHSSKKIITGEMLWIIFGVGILTNTFLFALFLFFLDQGYPIEKIRTIIFAGLAIDSIFFVYSIKNLRQPIWQIDLFSNKYLLTASTVSVLMLVAALTFPPLMSLLSLVSLNSTEMIMILTLGVLDLAAIEVAKFYFIHRSQVLNLVVK